MVPGCGVNFEVVLLCSHLAKSSRHRQNWLYMERMTMIFSCPILKRQRLTLLRQLLKTSEGKTGGRLKEPVVRWNSQMRLAASDARSGEHLVLSCRGQEVSKG